MAAAGEERTPVPVIEREIKLTRFAVMRCVANTACKLFSTPMPKSSIAQW